jgi:hypothetical protein
MSSDFDDLYGSRFLSGTDLMKPDTATIQTVSTENFAKFGEASKIKAVLYFEKRTKGVVLNKTNATNLAHAFGKSMQKWVGKRVTLRREAVNYGGKTVAGIRVYPADGAGIAEPAPNPGHASDHDDSSAQDEPWEQPPF